MFSHVSEAYNRTDTTRRLPRDQLQLVGTIEDRLKIISAPSLVTHQKCNGRGEQGCSRLTGHNLGLYFVTFHGFLLLHFLSISCPSPRKTIIKIYFGATACFRFYKLPPTQLPDQTNISETVSAYVLCNVDLLASTCSDAKVIVVKGSMAFVACN